MPSENAEQSVTDVLFQSSPNPKVGCHLGACAKRWPALHQFQSSPNPKVGCHIEYDRVAEWRHCGFNPHPTRRLGAMAEYSKRLAKDIRVSILTQPEGWVPCQAWHNPRTGRTVSILTQPEGWVPWSASPSRGRLICCFNPHPTRRLGAIRFFAHYPHPPYEFQSSPNPKVGCHQRAVSRSSPRPQFQSSPNPKVGCHSGPPQIPWQPYCFNPHPTRRLGAMSPDVPFVRGRDPFQSSPNPKVGCHQPA